MRRIIVSEFITLDGVIQDPGGAEGFARGGWSFKFFNDEYMKFKFDELFSADALLLGRRTYEVFAEAWPGRIDESGFADRMNGLPKYVVSNTLQKADWSNTTIVKGDLAREIQTLKDQPGGDILVAGSAMLVQGLLHEGVIDEIRLMLHPILLGEGRKLFADGAATTVMRLAETQTFSSGVIVLTYEPVAEEPETRKPYE